MKKRVKLITQPIGIFEHTDRWGVLTGEYYISSYVLYLDEDFWKEVDEFQRFKPKLVDNTKEIFSELKPSMSWEESLEIYRKAVTNIEDMERLLGRSKATIWQFNAYSNEKPLENGDEEYIRSFASFGHINIVEHKYVYDVQKFLLRPVVYFMNLWSYHFGENKAYRKWLKECDDEL